MRALITIRVQWYVVNKKTIDCQFKINSEAPLTSFINSVLMNFRIFKKLKQIRLRKTK